MQLLRLVLSACAAAVMVVLPKQCMATPSPILFVPGVMGSRLEVNDNGGPSKCETFQKYEELWVEPLHLVLNTACAKRELPLLYDPATDSFHNNTKVKIHVPDFGRISSVEYLNPTWLKDTIAYLHEFVEYFVDRGYERDKTIRAAPYDWRLAGDELDKRGYYHQFKALLEEMYESNDRTKVTIVAHSMGGPISLYFLTAFTGIDQAWKDKYIHAYVTLTGAWAGCLPALQTVVSGAHGIPDYMLFASDLISDFVTGIFRTFESVPWMIPQPSVFGDAVLISTPSKSYSAKDYSELFSVIGYTNGYRFFKHTQAVNPDFPAPNVPTHCFYGTNVDTPLTYRFKKDFVPGKSVIGIPPSGVDFGDGDGTINIESSLVCHRWSSMPKKYPFEYKAYEGINHQGIVNDLKSLNDIALIVGAHESKKGYLDTLWDWLG